MNLLNFTGSEFQNQEQLGHDLEYWLSPRGSQSSCSFFSEEAKQESKWVESPALEVLTINNPATDGYISKRTMMVVKWSGAVEGLGDKVDYRLCVRLYK